jgi:hypothetical protein
MLHIIVIVAQDGIATYIDRQSAKRDVLWCMQQKVEK